MHSFRCALIGTSDMQGPTHAPYPPRPCTLSMPRHTWLMSACVSMHPLPLCMSLTHGVDALCDTHMSSRTYAPICASKPAHAHHLHECVDMVRCGAHAYSQPKCDQRPHVQTAHSRTVPPVNAWYLCLHPCPCTRLPYAYMPGTTQGQCMLHISLCITAWPTHSPGLCPLQDPRPMPAHASSCTRSVQLTCACTHACSCTHKAHNQLHSDPRSLLLLPPVSCAANLGHAQASASINR